MFVHRKLNYLALLPNSENNWFFTSRRVHKAFGGNKNDTLINKLKNNKKCKKLIKPINKVISV
jgi:hypothetical protein